MFPALVVIALCAALVAIGVVIVVRWGDGVPEPSANRAARTPAGSPLMRLARYGAIMAASGVVAGVLAAGAGGRIAMRVLALTSSDLRGTITEGGAVIGDITIGGTASFIFFVGLTSGLLSGALYGLLFALLPRGRAGGLLLGVTLLVLAGSRIEPLRADNIDFVLVGPDWLSVLLFVSLALFQGMLVVAVAGRLSGGALPVWPAGRRAVVLGRVAAGAVVLALLPSFASTVSDILTSA